MSVELPAWFHDCNKTIASRVWDRNWRLDQGNLTRLYIRRTEIIELLQVVDAGDPQRAQLEGFLKRSFPESLGTIVARFDENMTASDRKDLEQRGEWRGEALLLKSRPALARAIAYAHEELARLPLVSRGDDISSHVRLIARRAAAKLLVLEVRLQFATWKASDPDYPTLEEWAAGTRDAFGFTANDRERYAEAEREIVEAVDHLRVMRKHAEYHRRASESHQEQLRQQAAREEMIEAMRIHYSEIRFRTPSAEREISGDRVIAYEKMFSPVEREIWGELVSRRNDLTMRQEDRLWEEFVAGQRLDERAPEDKRPFEVIDDQDRYMRELAAVRAEREKEGGYEVPPRRASRPTPAGFTIAGSGWMPEER